MNDIKILLCVIMLASVCGCKSCAWYRPGRSIQQASRDCEECRYEALKYGSGPSQGYIYDHSTEVLIQCMRLRGYSFIDPSDLIESGRVSVRRGGPFYTVVGK